MKYIPIFFIKLYRKILSPLKRTPCCRFYPTCSRYALDAYRLHGFFGGTYLSVKRILRCNPFCRGGIDKVPEKITFGRNKEDTSNKNGEL